MIGFFEHQYLSYKKNHLKNLLSLAKADGHFHEKEKAMLEKIGKRYGLKDKQIRHILDDQEPFEVNIPDNFNDRMNLIYDVLLMVYADEVVEKEEIKFCESMMESFGMKKDLVKWLLNIFDQGVPPIGEAWEEVKKNAKKEFGVKG